MAHVVRRYQFQAFPSKSAFMAYYSPLQGMKVSAYLVLESGEEEYWDADNINDLYCSLELSIGLDRAKQSFTLTVEEVRGPAPGDPDPSFDSWEPEAQAHC
jgi:hypothetical protein